MYYELPWNTILIPLILAAAGVGLAIFGWLTRRKVEASQSWFPATGVVIASSLKKHYRKGGVDYEPQVAYTYTIMGTPYSGKRFCFGTQRLSQKKAWEKLAKYPMNGKIIVYYNPEKPTEAVLEREAPGATAMMVGGGFMALTAAALFVLPRLSGLF
jgi:hypothetical protein